jgi:type II secretory pathway component GspD/PulD (secretin)
LLVENNYARLLAEPTLLTKSGSEASFLVGEERPIVQQLPTSVTVDYKKIGVQMKIKPTADSQNRITTTIHAEVSQVTGLTPQLEIPIIGTKTADSTLQVNDGQTIIIGGLLENNLSRDALRKVPWLADIPLFGYLFRHREKSVQQREVLFFMTPSIVKDVDAATAGAARSPLMQQWNREQPRKDVLEVPKPDEPTLKFKAPPSDPEPLPAPKKAPSTNFAPARSGGR